MMTFLLTMVAIPCNSHWPANDGVRSPQNVMIWAIQSSVDDTLELQSDEDDERIIVFRAVEGRTMTRSGKIWQAFTTDEAIESGCYRDRNFDGETCVGDSIDDEAPIDPILEAAISVPTYGSPGNSGGNLLGGEDFAPMIRSCSGGGDGNGNLTVRVEADENGPLIALITVKTNGSVLREEAVFLDGPMNVRLNVGDHDKLTVEARLVDRAGQIGDLASVEVLAPAGGCSHSPMSLVLLFGLAGLRRRQRLLRPSA